MANLKATEQYAYFLDYFHLVLRLVFALLTSLIVILHIKVNIHISFRNPGKLLVKQNQWSGYLVQV